MSDQLIHEIDKGELITGLIDVLDKYSCGIIVLNNKALPVHINSAGYEIFNANDGLKLLNGKVLVNSVPAQAVLKLIFQKFLEGKMSHNHSEMVLIPRPSGRPSYQLIASPLTGEIGADTSSSLMALFVCDPLEKQIIKSEQLQNFYGLTASESKLAVLIAQGKTLNECAGLLDHKISTSRTILKRVFQKTGTSKQHELVALVLNHTFPLQLNEFSTIRIPHLADD